MGDGAQDTHGTRVRLNLSRGLSRGGDQGPAVGVLRQAGINEGQQGNQRIDQGTQGRAQTDLAGDRAALSEDAPPQAIFMSELCQRWERTAQGMAAHGVAVTAMRLGVVMGRQGALPKMLQPFRLGLGVQMGGGDQMLSWIHLDDVLGAVQHLINQWQANPAKPPAGAYNFTAPHPVSQREFTRTACTVLRRPLSVPVPAALLGLMLGEQAALLTEGQRVIPQRLLTEGYRFRFERFEAALRDIEHVNSR